MRREALRTLAAIYEHRQIADCYMDTICSLLAHCVLSDLHWEVKLEALHFWELELNKQFTNQGMIDGTFPTVTFSKEHKKIVTLTEKEIHLRILKVFNSLSKRGFLDIILKCLHDECDLEVIKAAVCMIHCLLQQLEKYNFESLVESMEKLPVPNNNNTTKQATSASTMEVEENAVAGEVLNASSSLSVAEHSKSDEVIESILSSQDVNLLAAAYSEKMQLNGNNVAETRCIDAQLYKNYTSVGVKEFIDTIKSMDLKQLVKNQDWLLVSESFLSLLDDIICMMNQQDESLFADCY